ncbi:hypothetical protein AN958_08023 [Leucoagaricus sp. SymC.cos]|nr:hypothetical protein AN958_08023 [Leucoagaricus sp. SymC.cos]
MSSETTVARRKRPSSEADPIPEGDHRKRRRNRTTQSCLNCHTSKRMCDRKRPACARCTQLGLTGLCVYEVDDPNQRSDCQDESARLLKRVAELEGVIREVIVPTVGVDSILTMFQLKNKPHPRWVSAAASAVELEKWASRTHLRATSEGGQDQNSNASSPSSSLSDKSELSSPGGRSTRSSSTNNAYPPSICINPGDRRPSQTTVSSPQSTPSPGLVTPTDEFARAAVSLVTPPEAPQEYDLASMFLSYPGLMNCDPASFGALGKEALSGDPCFIKEGIGHCGCLHEAANYNVLLELSLRLRKAADILARSTSHQLGHQCHLQQRISELDILATNTLGSVSTPPEDLPTSVIPGSDISQSSLNNSLQFHPSPPFTHSCRAAISPYLLQSVRSWDLLPTVAGSPTSCEDSFMTWEPSRRP